MRKSMSSIQRAKLAGFVVLLLGFTSPVLADTAHILEDTFAASGTKGTAPVVTVSPGIAGYMRFSLAAVPEGTVAERAVLRLWVSDVSASGRVDLRLVTSPWSEGALK